MAQTPGSRDTASPSGPREAASLGLPNGHQARSAAPDGIAEVSATPSFNIRKNEKRMLLELQDGSTYRGCSFGADRSIAGEVVFQTGMVGYYESMTDPSYRGQILVMTWPLVGNYGVPARKAMDELLEDVPANFESAEIHIAGLVVASYCGEDYSHHLASSSLGAWLKEQRIPALYGIDTRALTKKIRKQGSMLARLSLEQVMTNGIATAAKSRGESTHGHKNFVRVDWIDPNKRNLVADGMNIGTLE